MAIFANFQVNIQAQKQGNFFGNSYGSASSSRGVYVTAEGGSFKVNTPYSATFVSDLKNSIPATGRKWDSASKCWYVSEVHADILKTLIDRAYNCDVQMPTIIAAKAQSVEVEFQADYVANSKNEASSVHTGGGWNAKIPEKVLRKWFKQADTATPATYYGLLGIDQNATDQEVKKAYKRAARTWHPDICREPNAREMFEKVREAYDILGNTLQRNLYNTGLAFEAMANTRNSLRGGGYKTSYSSFVPVLRCGVLRVRGHKELGILVVDEILAWEDVTNAAGQIMVSSWADDSFITSWM